MGLGMLPPPRASAAAIITARNTGVQSQYSNGGMYSEHEERMQHGTETPPTTTMIRTSLASAAPRCRTSSRTSAAVMRARYGTAWEVVVDRQTPAPRTRPPRVRGLLVEATTPERRWGRCLCGTRPELQGALERLHHANPSSFFGVGSTFPGPGADGEKATLPRYVADILKYKRCPRQHVISLPHCYFLLFVECFAAFDILESSSLIVVHLYPALLDTSACESYPTSYLGLYTVLP